MRPSSNLLFVLALTLSSLAASAAIDSNNTRNTTEQCNFDGDSSTYGLGIRIGFYFQHVATRIAICFTREMPALMRHLNDGFQFSTFAGLLYITLTDGKSSNSGQLYAIEAYIMLMLCMTGVGNGSTNRMSVLGEFHRILCTAAIIFYGTWFVYFGMDGMAHPPCSNSVFFFTNVDLYGWYRTFLKVFVTISAAFMGYVLVRLTCLHTCVWVRNEITWANNDTIEHEDLCSLTDLLISLLRLTFSILTIELTIKWNNIQGVNELGSTGQLLPLIIGVSNLVMVFF